VPYLGGDDTILSQATRRHYIIISLERFVLLIELLGIKDQFPIKKVLVCVCLCHRLVEQLFFTHLKQFYSFQYLLRAIDYSSP
jgi:hypothetical protein